MNAVLVIFALLLAFATPASAAIFDVKVQCKNGPWDFTVELTQDNVVVGTATGTCPDPVVAPTNGKGNGASHKTNTVRATIDTATAVPNDLNVTTTSDTTTCSTAVPAQATPLEEAKFSCDLKVDDGPREKISVKVELEDEDEDEDED